MHEWVETGISAVLLALAIAFFVGFILPTKVKERSARQVEILKLRRLAEEEEEHFGQQSKLEYTSMLLNSKKICPICLNPAPKLCSRCKAVRYCSQDCQHQHWKQGHKYECVPVKVDGGKSSAKISPVAETPVAPVALPTSEEQISLPTVESVPATPEAAPEAPATEIVVAPEAEIAPTESLSPEAAPAPAEAPAPAPAPDPAPAPAPAPAPESAPDPTPAPLPPSAPAAGSSPSPAAVVASAPPPAEVPVDSPVAALPEIAPEVKPSHAEELAPQAPTTPADGKLSKPKKILFPYEAFVSFFNWDMLRLPPCGLINCGNSCFANVVLQCLTYTRPLTAYLAEGIHGKACRRNDWCFMCELQQHVCRVKQSQNPFSPIRILSRIRDIGNHLGYGRQEDAHEFMRFAIDSMQSTCLDEFGGEKAVDARTQETTLIHHIFGGHLQSQVKCMQCQHESNRYESMMDLAVEIQGFVESLEDALAQFTAPECLDGDNKYKCDRCNAYVQARKRLAIHEAPNVLTIALKRFQSGKFGKLNKRVTFPEVLDISPYMSGKGDNPPAYQLYAVVVHVDMLNASFFGHYICYVKNSLGSWYKIDDSKVKEVDMDKVLAQKAYMLLYSRSNARPAPMVGAGGGYVSSSTKAPTLLRDGIAVANGHHASGHYSPRVHAFASKVPGVMPAITGTLCVGNGSFQRVGEGHGSSWIQDGGGSVSPNSVSPWTEDVEMASINADDSAEDAQNPDSGFLVADYRMPVGESNQDRQKELFTCCGPPDFPSDHLLTLKAGKRRLDAGVSHLPLSKGLDDWLPSWPSANHNRSSSCPSSLHATSDCVMSSSSLTPDVCSAGATDSIESEYNRLDSGGNQNGCFPDAGERGEGASDIAPETFQVELAARAKRQHIEYKTNGKQSSVIRKSSDSTMNMEWAEIECDESDSVSEAKSEALVPVLGYEQMERLPEASLGIQVEGVEVSSLSACDLFLCQGGITHGVSSLTSLDPISSARAHQDIGGIEHSAVLEESVSSVADDSSGCLDGVSTAVRTRFHQVASNGTVRDKGLKLEPVITNTGVDSSNSSIPRVQIKLKPLISPGFLNRSLGPKGRPKALASKWKTGEDSGVACPEEDSNGLKASGNTGKQLSGAPLHSDLDNGLLHSRVVENGVSNGPPPKERAKSMRAGANGSGRSGENATATSLVGGEPLLLPVKEGSTNQAVKATHNGGKVAASRHKQGRNEICACGSQRKWKKCCGKADVMKVETRRVVV